METNLHRAFIGRMLDISKASLTAMKLIELGEHKAAQDLVARIAMEQANAKLLINSLVEGKEAA